MAVGRRRLKYPSSSDLAEALKAVVCSTSMVHPSNLVELVKEELKRRGFYPGLVNAKRVWRTYLGLVKKGFLPDVLGVIEEA